MLINKLKRCKTCRIKPTLETKTRFMIEITKDGRKEPVPIKAYIFKCSSCQLHSYFECPTEEDARKCWNKLIKDFDWKALKKGF